MLVHTLHLFTMSGEGVDEYAIINEVSGYPDQIGERANKEFWSIDGTNALL